MNAYEILGLEEPKKIEEETTSQNQQTDILIRERVKKRFRQLIEQLNSYLEDDTLTLYERIKKADDVIPNFLKFYAAYEKINTSTNRTQYSNSHQDDIEAEVKEMLNNMQKRLTIPAESPKNKKAIEQNPYNILGIRNNPDTLTDSTVDTRTYSLLRLTVSKSAPSTLEESGEMLFKVTKYLCAHSLVETEEKRDAYPYKLRARDAVASNKGNIANLNLAMAKVPFATDELETGDGHLMQVIKDGRLEYGPFFLKDESNVNHYIIRIRNSKGEINESNVYGNININKMNSSSEYAKQVVDKLLSDKSVQLSKKYFGGYVGEITEDGNVKFDDEIIAACILRQRQLEKQEKNNSNAGKKTNNPGVGQNKNVGNSDIGVNPDVGDDR